MSAIGIRQARPRLRQRHPPRAVSSTDFARRSWPIFRCRISCARPPVRPSGFIFHMSRCGSTLLTQMLAALAHNIVISEASPIDAVVRAPHVRPALSDDQHALWLRWMIGALGQPRSGNERHYFIKLDCWHTLALPLFRRAFPDVPWGFLYRDPVEVLVSQLRMPGPQIIPRMLGPN